MKRGDCCSAGGTAHAVSRAPSPACPRTAPGCRGTAPCRCPTLVIPQGRAVPHSVPGHGPQATLPAPALPPLLLCQRPKPPTTPCREGWGHVPGCHLPLTKTCLITSSALLRSLPKNLPAPLSMLQRSRKLITVSCAPARVRNYQQQRLLNNLINLNYFITIFCPIIMQTKRTQNISQLKG